MGGVWPSMLGFLSAGEKLVFVEGVAYKAIDCHIQYSSQARWEAAHMRHFGAIVVFITKSAWPGRPVSRFICSSL